MADFAFEALGTHWSILIEGDDLQGPTLQEFVLRFEKKYSRFLPDSEVSRINKSKKREFRVSDDLATMLTLGKKLEELTEGHFNLNLKRLMSGYGYDAKLSLEPRPKEIKPPQGKFYLEGQILYKGPEVEFDLGSLGKGYLIDQVAGLLKTNGLSSYIIDGGGDIYGSIKADGRPWKIAIEHPSHPEQIIGSVELSNRALASSSANKRRFRNFHHLLDAVAAIPTNEILAVSVLADQAAVADACATAIFVSPSKFWPVIAREFKIDYLVVLPDLSYQKTDDFPELF